MIKLNILFILLLWPLLCFMCMISLLWEFGVFGKNKYNREATKYYFNPEKFKIYENGLIPFHISAHLSD